MLSGIARPRLKRHLDDGIGPFEGVVEQIAQHLLEILPLTAEAQALRHGVAASDAPILRYLHEGAQQRVERGRSLGHPAERSRERGRASPVQIVLDLIAHHGALLFDRLRQMRLVASALRLVHHDAERGLERMGEVADLRAGTFQNFPVRVDELVEFVGEGFKVRWIATGDTLRFARSNRPDGSPQPDERPQAEADLNQGRRDEDESEQEEGHRQGEAEILDVALDLVGRRGDRHCEAAIFPDIDLALENPQQAIVRPRNIALAQAATVGRDRLVEKPGQLPADERAGRAHARPISVEPGDLPIPAGQRQVEARLAEIADRLPLGLRRRRQIGHELLDVDGKPLVEAALCGATVEGGETEPRQHEDQDAAERRRKEQPRTQRKTVGSERHVLRSDLFGSGSDVAESPHGLDDFHAELLAQPADENLDRVGIAVEILIVEMLDQLGARHHPALMMHQIGEQPIFVRGQLDRVAVDHDAAGPRIETNRTAD